KKTENGSEVEINQFEEIMDEVKKKYNAELDTDLNVEALKLLVEKYKAVVKKETGKDFPEEPKEQLKMAVNAVFESWNTKRAIEYRRIYGIPDNWGTAVNIQTMVFGNMGETSGTGVAFTRNPATGEKRFFGEFLVNAQGEDVVAGVRTPEPITALQARAPKVYEELVAIKDRLERHYRDMQGIEFTIQDGALFLLQTRSGKRTAKAAVRMAVEMVREGLIDKETALLRLEPHRLHELLHFIFDPTDKARAIGKGRLLAKGLPAGPGAAVGRVVFNADRAVEWAKSGQKVLLVRPETSPEDVAGMWAAEGILTSRGGLTSHAAVVARGMGKCCIVGAGDIFVDEERRAFQAGRTLVREGDLISIDGHTGEILPSAVTRIPPPISEELRVFLKCADETRTLGVRAK